MNIEKLIFFLTNQDGKGMLELKWQREDSSSLDYSLHGSQGSTEGIGHLLSLAGGIQFSFTWLMRD